MLIWLLFWSSLTVTLLYRRPWSWILIDTWLEVFKSRSKTVFLVNFGRCNSVFKTWKKWVQKLVPLNTDIVSEGFPLPKMTWLHVFRNPVNYMTGVSIDLCMFQTWYFANIGPRTSEHNAVIRPSMILITSGLLGTQLQNSRNSWFLALRSMLEVGYVHWAWFRIAKISIDPSSAK